MSGWIGVDLDGTLAVYEKFEGPTVIGKPIKPMVEKVKRFLKDGHDVRIFTARVSHDGTLVRRIEAIEAELAIVKWCIEVFDRPLPITNVKDYSMWVLYDDRAIQVEKNTGLILSREDHLGLNTTP